LSSPIVVKSGLSLRTRFDQIEQLTPVMRDFVSYSRITGALLVISFIVDFLIK